MALWTGSDDWHELLTKIGIPADSAKNYAKTLVEENITKDSLIMIDQEVDELTVSLNTKLTPNVPKSGCVIIIH